MRNNCYIQSKYTNYDELMRKKIKIKPINTNVNEQKASLAVLMVEIEQFN